ncbi:MAG: oligopeptide/dipeptide transporter, ATPase subunit [Acidimicrobiales bacterium]|nr:oligopeptide/dipeptide transporter, ATPase subunit [Acidimicrobiales bacterium]
MTAVLDAAPPRATGTVLAARDLRISFPGGVNALRGVSLDVAPGEIVGVVGESGSGKTVLGLAALGLLAPSAEVAGEVLLGTTDMVSAGAEERRLTRKRLAGAVFQDPMTSLNPTMRVGRQVAEAAGSMDAAIEMLERARIPEPARRARQYPHELSGGLRQRVMIAMALAGAPALVVADEPTTALDVTVQAEVLKLLAELRDATGTSILFVTHDLAVAAGIADRIAVLYAGRLAEVGPTAAVLGHPDHPYTAGLLAARLQPDSPRGVPLPTLKGEPPDPRRLPPGCPFAPRCALAEPECDEALPEPEPAPGHTGLVACRRSGEPARVALDVYEKYRRSGEEDVRPALRLRGISKSFGRRKGRRLVVDDLSLEVPAGGAVALVGESGCGKTTTLRIAVGLEPADGGAVELGPGGRPQLVFQDAGASLTPWMTIGELLEERLRAEGLGARERRTRARDALGLVGLPDDVAARRPRELSGGQRQRVAIARAVVVPPALLACDEPISALDVSLAATMLNLLSRLRAELGMAMLFVTHDLAAARYVGDRVAVMADGRIVEEGSPELVLAAPSHGVTKALVGAIPRLDAG